MKGNVMSVVQDHYNNVDIKLHKLAIASRTWAQFVWARFSTILFAIALLFIPLTMVQLIWHGKIV